MQTRINNIDDEIEYINNKIRYGAPNIKQLLEKRESLIEIKDKIIIGNPEAAACCCDIVDACCASIINDTTITGVLPVILGGTSLNNIPSNGVLLGNGTNIPSIQIINGSIIDNFSNQSLANKIIDGACNTITATYFYSGNNVVSVSGIPLIGNVLAIQNINGNNISATWQYPTGLSGILPVIQGGTGYSSFNGVLIGNNTSTPTIQSINGSIIDSNSTQSFVNKIIDCNCNSLTNVPLSKSIGFGTNKLTNSMAIVNDTSIKATSIITLTYNSLQMVDATTQGVIYVGQINPGIDFTVYSNKYSDNNSFSYICIY